MIACTDETTPLDPGYNDPHRSQPSYQTIHPDDTNQSNNHAITDGENGASAESPPTKPSSEALTSVGSIVAVLLLGKMSHMCHDHAVS